MMENKTKIDLKNTSIFITGASGFIGSNLAKRILTTVEGAKVVGLDNMNHYYDVRLKEARLDELNKFENFSFVKGNLADKETITTIFEQYKPQIVVNLGAQAGVRYSITNPDAYVEANLIGFYNILEACRHSYDEGHTPVEHLVYASSSSVYGSNKKVPYSTDDKVDNPVSLYAATKKSNELMAHAYSKLYNIPSTGLRFFTVYGPAGRPDMAYFGFTNKLLKGETIQIFNYGNCKRDFTYVDDIVEGVVRVMQGAPERRNGEDGLPIPPYAVYNIGNQNPENLLDFVQILQEELPHLPIVTITGPSHAEEVARNVPTTVVAASTDAQAAEYVQKTMSSETLRLYRNSDIIGCEVGGALKNIIALSAGICDGLGCGDNTKAALMTRGMHEITKLGVAMGGQRETFAGLSGIGDLIVTCCSMHSRNRRAGILIGEGVSPEEAVRQVGTVEGYHCCEVAYALSQQMGVSMPITEQLNQVLFHGGNPKDAIYALMCRPQRSEWVEQEL